MVWEITAFLSSRYHLHPYLAGSIQALGDHEDDYSTVIFNGLVRYTTPTLKSLSGVIECRRR
jgi:hypothetical protein